MNTTTLEERFQLAVGHHQAGRLAPAEELYREILQEDPRHALAQFLLGRVALQLGKPDLAVEEMTRAIGINGDNPAYHNDLGLAYQALSRFDEAIAAFQQALKLKPDFFEVNYNLGRLYFSQGRLGEATERLTEVVQIRPDQAEVWNTLGAISGRMGRLDEAVDHCQRALALQPEMVDAHFNLGNAFFDMGRADQARFCYEQALALRPDHAATHGNLVFTLLYLAGSTPAEILAAHRRYAELCEGPLKPFWPAHANKRDPARRIRVGYVSSDFRTHSVASFMEPILAQHDKSQVEVCCYYNHADHDAVTDRLASYTDHWIPCAELSDDALAARIQADGIDILVDLAGRTRGNRLLVFARKPAPVQVTYLGYPATTGLTAMDYRLTTWDVDPKGNEAWYTEHLYRLPRTLWCYRPADDMPEAIAQTPAHACGYVTFGSMNALTKVSGETIGLWAEILRAVPRSRLVMTSIPEGSARELLCSRFEERGIERARLTLHGKLPRDEFLALPSRVDLVLDPFPYNGTTTTCDALWMGLPVVTLIGQTAVARSGYAILKALGLAELAAGDQADYVHIANDLACNTDRLTALRLGMRARFKVSPLRDERGLARVLETGFRNMWQIWCTSKMAHPA